MASAGFRVVSKSEGRHLSAHNVDVQLLLAAEQTAREQKMPSAALNFGSTVDFVLRNWLGVGTANEPHTHQDVEKVYFVIRGRAEVRCGADTSNVMPGDVFFFPVGVEHSMKCLGDEDFECFVVAARVLQPGAVAGASGAADRKR
jgi:mannose-6-phosphate isomerase-like protein (cupin superfamily)